MEKNKRIEDKSGRKKKWDYFFAFYRIYAFYKLWFILYVLSIVVFQFFEVPLMLILLGSIIISTIASLVIYGVIIIVSDIHDGESIESNNCGGKLSAQTMRMLKRNIRRRWL